MKKIGITMLILSASAFGEMITLDEMLNTLDRTSYQNEVYKTQKQIDTNKEKVYKKDNYNGVSTSVTSKYNDDEQAFVTTGLVKYGDFYVDAQRNNADKDKKDEATFGFEKSVKDLIFSKNKNNLEKLNITKEINRLQYKGNLETQKLSLIALYRDYRSDELELKIRENGLKNLNKELEILSKSYNLGATQQIELRTLQYNIKNQELEIETLKNSLAKMKNRFFYDFGIDVGNRELEAIHIEGINLEKYISQVGTRSLSLLDLEKQVTEKNLKYLNYDDKMPELSLGVEHNTRYNENRLTAKVSKDLFYFNSELENEKENLKSQEIVFSQKENEIRAERLKIWNTLYSYEKSYEVNANKAELEKAKYEIKRLEYRVGKSGYIDVMDSFNDYLEYEIARDKAKNTLNSYVYEIMVRGEK
jgi:outer membrane protein TolC